MSSAADRSHVEDVIASNRYLALATTDGETPWVAAVEYLFDGAGTFAFFSTADARHAVDIEAGGDVSLAIYGEDQPAYASDLTASLNGVQIRGRAARLEPDAYPDAVLEGIEALDPPMPPYEVYAVTAETVYVPRIEDGVNTRVEVEMGW